MSAAAEAPHPRAAHCLPAWETADAPRASTRTLGYSRLRFTLEVLLARRDQDPRQVPSFQVRSTFTFTTPSKIMQDSG